MNFLIPKTTYFVCGSKILWIKHSTIGHSWEELSWSYRQTLFISSHYISLHCLESTIIPPPFTKRFHIHIILLKTKHSSAWGVQHLTRSQKRLLLWDKEVYNKLQGKHFITWLDVDLNLPTWAFYEKNSSISYRQSIPKYNCSLHTFYPIYGRLLEIISPILHPSNHLYNLLLSFTTFTLFSFFFCVSCFLNLDLFHCCPWILCIVYFL